MADNRTIQKNVDKYTTQAFYTKALHDHGSDVAYTFVSRDDPKYIISKALQSVGVYYGENDLTLPDKFKNRWIITGYNIGKRKEKNTNVEKVQDTIDEKSVMIERIERIKFLLLNHSDSFSNDENDLLNVGVYYRKNNLELPMEFSSPLVWIGYYDIPLDIVYNNDREKHIRK